LRSRQRNGTSHTLQITLHNTHNFLIQTLNYYSSCRTQATKFTEFPDVSSQDFIVIEEEIQDDPNPDPCYLYDLTPPDSTEEPVYNYGSGAGSFSSRESLRAEFNTFPSISVPSNPLEGTSIKGGLTLVSTHVPRILRKRQTATNTVSAQVIAEDCTRVAAVQSSTNPSTSHDPAVLHPINACSFKCLVCWVGFRTEEALRAHEAGEEGHGHRLLTCTECEIEIPGHDLMLTHKRRFHENQMETSPHPRALYLFEEKEYACPECENWSDTMVKFRQHYAKHHYPAPAQEPRYYNHSLNRIQK